MKIYVIRHSMPEDTDYDDDPDPGLTDEGKEIIEALAEWMADKEEIPSMFYAGPTLRTQETAEVLRDALVDRGFDIPAVQTAGSIGPHMSIRSLVQKVANDKAQVRVGIVSHHESIAFGLRELNGDPWPHLDQLAQGELRILKIKRKDGSWKEHRRVLPSDIGQNDHY